MYGVGPVLGSDTSSCDRVLMVLGSQEIDLMAALCLRLAAKSRSLWTYHQREGDDEIRPGAAAAARVLRVLAVPQNLAAALFADKTVVLVTP